MLQHISRENAKEYKATVVPFGVGKTYAMIRRYIYWPKMIRNIQAHVEIFSLCRREKLQADKCKLQTREIPLKPFAKVSIDLVVDLPTSHNENKNILGMVDHLTGYLLQTKKPP